MSLARQGSLAEKLEELLNQTSEILHNDSQAGHLKHLFVIRQAKNLAQSPFPAGAAGLFLINLPGALLPTASVGSREKNAETHRKELSKLHNETIWHDPMSLFCCLPLVSSLSFERKGEGNKAIQLLTSAHQGFAVVVESEMPLIKWQRLGQGVDSWPCRRYKHQVGIFKCTTWAVYSNGVDALTKLWCLLASKTGAYAHRRAGRSLADVHMARRSPENCM